MHTVEIAGRPTLVVNGSKDEVQDLLTDSWLLEELLVLETQAGLSGLAITRISSFALHLGTRLHSGRRLSAVPCRRATSQKRIEAATLFTLCLSLIQPAMIRTTVSTSLEAVCHAAHEAQRGTVDASR